MRSLSLLVVVAGCAGQVGAPDETRAAATQPTPTLSFNADWTVGSSMPPMSGGKAVVHYDIARLPKCRTWYRGYPAWDIVANWSSDGGVAHSQPVTSIVNGQRVGVDIVIDVPPGRDLALWFHASDESGCDQWDSDYGRNFHFALQAGLPTVHFTWPGWSSSVDGTPTAGAALVVDYDIRRLPFCRQDYNGLATWDVTVGYQFDIGNAASAPLTVTTPGGQRVQAPAQLMVPSGARALQLWFENHDRTGCQTWDSAYGANYHVAIQ